jgi:dihydroflavonol-4-reductase
MATLKERKMKSLVTGANGFIGSAIVRELLKDGIEVKAMVRETSNLKNLEGLDIEKVYGDIRDKESVKSALKGCDTFYQTAALYNFWAPDLKTFDEINIQGTRTVLSAAQEQEVEKIVYTSSIVAVGYGEKDKPANEETEFNVWMGNPYARTKYLGELEARKLCEQGLPIVIVNPGVVLGIGDVKPTPSGQFIVNTLNKKMPGYYDGGFNMVDVEDVARGHILAAQKGRIGERYILGNENMDMKEFFDLVAEIGNVEPPKRKISYPMGITLAYMLKGITAITRKEPLITVAMAKMIGKYGFYDCSKAINELGIPQTPVRTTIEKAIDWFRENGYINQS